MQSMTCSWTPFCFYHNWKKELQCCLFIQVGYLTKDFSFTVVVIHGSFRLNYGTELSLTTADEKQ